MSERVGVVDGRGQSQGQLAMNPPDESRRNDSRNQEPDHLSKNLLLFNQCRQRAPASGHPPAPPSRFTFPNATLPPVVHSDGLATNGKGGLSRLSPDYPSHFKGQTIEIGFRRAEVAVNVDRLLPNGCKCGFLYFPSEIDACFLFEAVNQGHRGRNQMLSTR